MFEVIICTVSSGRVQRKSFDNWEQARAFADKWSEKGRSYRVSLERVASPAQVRRPQVGRSASM